MKVTRLTNFSRHTACTHVYAHMSATTNVTPFYIAIFLPWCSRSDLKRQVTSSWWLPSEHKEVTIARTTTRGCMFRYSTNVVGLWLLMIILRFTENHKHANPEKLLSWSFFPYVYRRISVAYNKTFMLLFLTSLGRSCCNNCSKTKFLRITCSFFVGGKAVDEPLDGRWSSSPTNICSTRESPIRRRPWDFKSLILGTTLFSKTLVKDVDHYKVYMPHRYWLGYPVKLKPHT